MVCRCWRKRRRGEDQAGGLRGRYQGLIIYGQYDVVLIDVQVFDAIEAVQGSKPRLIYVSAIDLRDRSTPPPAHYVRSSKSLLLTTLTSAYQTEADLALSERIYKAIPAYMHWKYEAEKVLTARTKFNWTSLRPGGLTNEPSTGKAALGKTHLSPTISVYLVLLILSSI